MTMSRVFHLFYIKIVHIKIDSFSLNLKLSAYTANIMYNTLATIYQMNYKLAYMQLICKNVKISNNL